MKEEGKSLKDLFLTRLIFVILLRDLDGNIVENGYANYQIQVWYSVTVISGGRPTKKAASKKVSLSPGTDVAKSGKIHVSIRLAQDQFLDATSPFRIQVISPRSQILKDLSTSIEEEEIITIGLADINNEQYVIELIEPQENPGNTISYEGHLLETITNLFKGGKRESISRSFEILPNFSVTNEFSGIEYIESVSLSIKTPKGQTISQTEWTNISWDSDSWTENNGSRAYELQLPSPQFIESNVYLEETLERKLDKWTDHNLKVNYVVLNANNRQVELSIEEKYPIFTDLQDAQQRGGAHINLKFYGIVDIIYLEVLSPKGEVIGKEKKKPEEIIDAGGEVVIKVPPRRQVDLLDLKLLPSRPQKTFGRLIDLLGREQLEDVQIIIYASKEEEPDTNDPNHFFPVVVVTTESLGYFFFSTPKESFTAAYASIGSEKLSEDERKIPIQLEGDDVVVRELGRPK